MSLRLRLALAVALVVGCVLAGVGIAAQSAASNELIAEIDSFLVERQSRVASGFSIGAPRRGAPFDPERVDPWGIRRGAPDLFDPDSVVQLVDATNGDLLLRLEGEPRLPFQAADLAGSVGGPGELETVTIDGSSYRLANGVIETPRGPVLVQVARSLDETDAAVAGIRNRLVVLGLAGTGLAALASWFVVGRAVRPIEKLTAVTEHVAATHELSTPIEVDRADEVGRLAASFNLMLAQLQRSREQQQRLVLDASHELRTPLTSLRTNIELLQRTDALGADDRARLMADVNSELSELTDLVAELVELATDRQASAEPMVEVDLLVVADEMAAKARRRHGRAITVTGSGTGGHVEARRAGIERAITNLVDNAVKFSPVGAPVAIQVDGASVSVVDRGPGIDEADIGRIFDRFYRSDEARGQPGSGLGLAIVSEIAAAHGGSVFAENEVAGGARIGFTLAEPPVDQVVGTMPDPSRA